MATGLFAETKVGEKLGANTIPPRKYQEEAVQAAREALKRQRAAGIVLPTGTGKSLIMAMVARACNEKGGRAMILADRHELISQNANTAERVGCWVGIEQADSYAAAYDPDVVVASKSTLHPKRIQQWPEDHFRVIICDEAHHATAPSYTRIFKHFRKAKLIGLTATPDRADEDEILDVFGSICYERTIWDMIQAPPPGPWLCRLKFVQCGVDIDLKDIRTTGGDFNAADLEAAIKPLIEVLANAIRQEVCERQTIVFCPDVGSSQAMATALQSLGLKAEWVSGDDPERDRKIDDYKKGVSQVICNCALLTEGFDAPATGAIVLCRPTKSRPLFSQMCGRGTRLKKGLSYDDCLIVDFNYLTRKHDLCRPADLFDRSDKSDEENQIIEEILERGKETQLDLIDVVAKASAEHRERQTLRIKAQAREVKYRRIAYDPLSVADSLGITMRQGFSAIHSPATEGQVRALERFKVKGVEGISKRQAGRLLDVVITRAKSGMASPGQVGYLIALGVQAGEARAMSRSEASARIDELRR
jgi:superfamily II DNA or RNA helicase